MSGAPIGAWDVVDRFYHILTDHLQDELNDLVAAAKVKDPAITWGLKAAGIVKGANENPRQRANFVHLFEDDANDEAGQFLNYTGPVRQEVRVWIRANVTQVDLALDVIDQQRSIYASAITNVLENYWRADGNPAHLFGVTLRTAHGSSSVRRTRGVLGTMASRLGWGGGGQDTIDPIRVVADCKQYRAQTTQLT